MFACTPKNATHLIPLSQEVTTDRYVDIPEAVQEIYRIWRPSPLFRAHNLEKALGTTCRIYYKYADALQRSTHFAFNVRFCSGTKVAAQLALINRTPLCRRYLGLQYWDPIMNCFHARQTRLTTSCSATTMHKPESRS